MISLIVNADDLGSNAARDRGILQAFQEGIVTSASLLANGRSFATAAAQVRDTGLPVGVHLNLADGATLSGPIEGLTDSCGELPGKIKLRQYLASGDCDTEAISKEFEAQIRKLLDADLQPDHIDSHQHCQIFPCLTAIMTKLALKYGLLAMRTSLPAEPVEEDPGGPLGEELRLYRRLAFDAHREIIASGLKTPDKLWGLPLLNQLNTANLCRLLGKLPEGCWELMTHPGYPWDQGRAFDGQERYTELQALLSSKAREIILQRKIRLCSFGELTCAS